ncbi:FAD-dependent oxidoreductase [Aquabacterium sp. A7-Y]|uniref:NAD(P)/FAD-dependent oxidoreductase n=1 Tax=Aquabacterium sp. A7-Y TaxID=1349605 RepID=UPI00223D1E55|nr:FAD-dependent oxidoreductase [Aquabacterium sp. A7-Y]MCW7537995.1 FAD-dependent oxidoreductase [Aquabacterium sp. A7-Y]
MSSKSGKQVVIFGGGLAGVQLARDLAQDMKVVLVDPNDYVEVPMAAPRSLVDPAFADDALIPYSLALPEVTHVRGRLIEMGANAGEVLVSDGQRISVRGDVHVLCTGSLYANALMRSSGATLEERKRLYRQYSSVIQAANRVLIVGGGPIGVEVAGELSESHPGKSIILLESGRRLLPGTSLMAAQHAASVLASRGVSILFGERLQAATTAPDDIFAGPGIATTSIGRKIGYDLLVWCTGGRPNTAYMKPLLYAALNEQGRVRVNPDLRVVGHPALFALGDITDLDENKMAWHIDGQVRCAADNIRRIIQGGRAALALSTYKPQTGNPKMAVTLGSQQGVLHLPFLGVIRSPWFTRKAKAEHMLVPRYRRLMNVG